MRHPMVAVALVLAGAVAEPLHAQAVRVQADPRVELMAIIFRLAGNPEYSQDRLAPYNTEVKRQFDPFREHEAVVLASELRDKHGVGFDAVMQMAIRVTNPPELRERVAFDSLGVRTAPPADVARFLAAARRFAVESRFGEFFAAHHASYDSAVARVRRPLERQTAFAWIGRFFGTAPDRDFVVVPMLVNSGTNFGNCVRPAAGRRECYQILGHQSTDSAGFPAYDEQVLTATLVHEATHGYANPQGDAHQAELAGSAARIFAATADAMQAQAYGAAGTVVKETLVRAVVARYLADRGATAELRAYLREQHARGWLWLDGLSDLFGRYEAERTAYPTFASFMPRVIAYFDTIADRLPDLQRQYDALRPKLVSLSIQNGSEAVDPATREIVLGFDRPVTDDGWSLRPVLRAAERLPNVRWQALAADSAAYRRGRPYPGPGTTLRLGVELEPAHAYELQLNGANGMGIRSAAEGAPMLPFVLRFRTRGSAD